MLQMTQHYRFCTFQPSSYVDTMFPTQCYCGHDDCPFCNLLLNLERTDPNLLMWDSPSKANNLPSWWWNKIRRREWTKTTCKPNGKWPGEKRRQLQKLSGWRDHSRLVDHQEDKIWQSDCLNIWREIYCCAIASCPWCFMHRKMISYDKYVVFYVYCITATCRKSGNKLQN